MSIPDMPSKPVPPYAHPKFATLCDGCGACVAVCPTGFLARGENHRPYADFAASSCDFCGACHHACTRGALVDQSPPWPVVAEITQNCLTSKSVTCRTCGDFCEHQAITFRLRVGGKTAPVIDTAACTGCGACVAPCPTNAIVMKG